MQDIHYLVPQHEQGLEQNLSHKIKLDTIENAEDWFVDSKERLLDVNNWTKNEDSDDEVKTAFHLIDSHGKQVKRHARKDDYINITNISVKSDSSWVHIDAIEYDDYPDLSMESFAVRVRPSAGPLHTQDQESAQWFSQATSIFVVERRGKELTAHYYSRNSSLVDVADAGTDNQSVLADANWTSIIKGFIELNLI